MEGVYYLAVLELFVQKNINLKYFNVESVEVAFRSEVEEFHFCLSSLLERFVKLSDKLGRYIFPFR